MVPRADVIEIVHKLGSGPSRLAPLRVPIDGQLNVSVIARAGSEIEYDIPRMSKTLGRKLLAVLRAGAVAVNCDLRGVVIAAQIGANALNELGLGSGEG